MFQHALQTPSSGRVAAKEEGMIMWLECNTIEWNSVNVYFGRSFIHWEGGKCTGIRFRRRIEKIMLITRYFRFVAGCLIFVFFMKC
jgi:hypothetical protein